MGNTFLIFFFHQSANNSNHMIYSLILSCFNDPLWVDNNLKWCFHIVYWKSCSKLILQHPYSMSFFKNPLSSLKNILSKLFFTKMIFFLNGRAKYDVNFFALILLYLINPVTDFFSNKNLKQHLAFTNENDLLFSQIFLVCE